MNAFLNNLILLSTAVFWEAVAWFMHKYFVHGFGWYLHQDHHISSGRRLQRGVALYGIGYVGFHDIMFHKRFKNIALNLPAPHIRRIINAHRIHHSTVTRKGAASFSFLWAPKKYSTSINQEQNE